MDNEKNKDVLAIVKQMISEGKITQEDAEKYFPELNGNRDDVIKKTLIQLLKEKKTVMYKGIMVNEMVEWVEKRSEPMVVLRYEVDESRETITKCPYRKESCFVSSVARIGSWSCERCPFYGGKAGSQEIYCKYKEKDGEQKHVEWSDEDKGTIQDIIDIVNMFDGDTNNKSEMVNFLISLRPQNTWNPSDAQMEALKEACDEHWEPDGLDPLYTLYQDIKKLREE